MSQRYCFLSALAARLPELKIVVHDDACHLRRMAESEAGVRELTQRLARDIHYTDEDHTPGHVGSCCREPCLPTIDTPGHFSHECRRVGELLFVVLRRLRPYLSSHGILHGEVCSDGGRGRP